MLQVCIEKIRIFVANDLRNYSIAMQFFLNDIVYQVIGFKPNLDFVN